MFVDAFTGPSLPLLLVSRSLSLPVFSVVDSLHVQDSLRHTKVLLFPITFSVFNASDNL